jgi:hypothetical protein
MAGGPILSRRITMGILAEQAAFICLRCGERVDTRYGCLCAECYQHDLEICMDDLIDELNRLQSSYVKLKGDRYRKGAV